MELVGNGKYDCVFFVKHRKCVKLEKKTIIWENTAPIEN